MAVELVLVDYAKKIKALKLTPKISSYSEGPFRNQSVLVFGKLVKKEL